MCSCEARGALLQQFMEGSCVYFIPLPACSASIENGLALVGTVIESSGNKIVCLLLLLLSFPVFKQHNKQQPTFFPLIERAIWNLQTMTMVK